MVDESSDSYGGGASSNGVYAGGREEGKKGEREKGRKEGRSLDMAEINEAWWYLCYGKKVLLLRFCHDLCDSA